MGVIGVHLRVGAARRNRLTLGCRPRTPRDVGDIEFERISPVAVHSSRRNPLPVHVARLHRELGPIPLQERVRIAAVRRPPLLRPVLGCVEKLTPRHASEEHLRPAVRTVEPSTFAGEVLLKGVAEEVGVRLVTRDRVPVYRRGTAARRTSEVESSERVDVVGRNVRRDRMPTESVRWRGVRFVFSHLSPKHVKPVAVHFATHWPEPGTEHGRAGTELEGHRSQGGTAMKQPEAASFLHKRRVVGKRCVAERRRSVRVVDERVLKQPQIPIATERVNVLIVPADHRSDPLRKELVETYRREVAGTSNIGR